MWWTIFLTWAIGIPIVFLAISLLRPFTVDDPVSAAGVVGFRLATSFAWPFVLVAFVTLGIIDFFARISVYSIECPVCEGDPVSEGIGGREAVCNRCNGKGRANVRWGDLKKQNLIRKNYVNRNYEGYFRID